MNTKEIFNQVYKTDLYEDRMYSIIPPHITMILENIIKNGGFTNNVDVFFLSAMMGLVQAGTKYWPRRLNNYPNATDAEFIDTIAQLPPEEVVKTAKHVLEALTEMEMREMEGEYVTVRKSHLAEQERLIKQAQK